MNTPPRKSCFAPVVDPATRVLILGSLPGDASLAAQQYYAHPQNQFWCLLGAVLGEPLAEQPYPQRLATMQGHGVGLWDVIAAAQRHGSLDSNIREQQHNDLAQLIASLPRLRLVAFNGQTAGRRQRQIAALGKASLILPSSSPAHTLAYAQKLQQWLALRSALQPDH